MDVRNVLGLRRFDDQGMRKVNLFETSRFFCDIYCLAPGQEQTVHEHASEDKIYHVLDGTAQVTVEVETGPLLAGEMVLCPAGRAHGIRNASDAEVTCLVFMAPHPKPPVGDP